MDNSFHNACRRGDLELAKKIWAVNPNIIGRGDFTFDKIFMWVCCYGHKHILEWVCQLIPDIDLYTNYEEAFRVVCSRGHLEIAKWIFENKPTLDISSEYEFVFHGACINGHLELAQWLYEIKQQLNLSYEHYDTTYYVACSNGKINIVKWLTQLYPERYEILEVSQDMYGDYIIDYKIHHQDDYVLK